jgi:transcriptional regulator with XRE-family HTH domain
MVLFMALTYEQFLQLSLTELEQASGIQATAWCRYFAGRRSMKVDTLTSLAEKLEMTPEDLLKGVIARTKVRP